MDVDVRIRFLSVHFRIEGAIILSCDKNIQKRNFLVLFYFVCERDVLVEFIEGFLNKFDLVFLDKCKRIVYVSEP